jgi:hypothetical protein
MDAQRQDDRDRLNDDGLAVPDAGSDIAETPPTNVGSEFGDVEAKRQVIAARRARQDAPEPETDTIARVSRGGDVPNNTAAFQNDPARAPS